jgi:hypothetical protein
VHETGLRRSDAALGSLRDGGDHRRLRLGRQHLAEHGFHLRHAVLDRPRNRPADPHLLQGRLFWRDQIAGLTSDGATYEATTSTWVGNGRVVSFAPHETSAWVAKAKSGSKELSTIAFKAKGQALEMSFLSPKLVDVAALSGLQPIFFAQLKRDYPDLKNLAG